MRSYQKNHLCILCDAPISDGSHYSGKKRCFNCYAKLCKNGSIPNAGQFKKGMIGTRTGTGMPKIALNCIYCQKEFSVRPCYKNHKYCSRKCYANSRFNPNRTDMDRWERKRFRNTVKQQVLLRDGYRCTMCGLSNNLQVDHIQPWSDYVELRFSMDNCRTLCQKCHYEITFGREMPSNITYWGQNSMKGELNA